MAISVLVTGLICIYPRHGVAVNSEINAAGRGSPLCALRVQRFESAVFWQDVSQPPNWEVCACSNTNHQENGDKEPGLTLMGGLGRRPKAASV